MKNFVMYKKKLYVQNEERKQTKYTHDNKK